VATTRAIGTVSQAVIGVLRDAHSKIEFEGAAFELYQASNFSNPMRLGLSLYLYRVTLNSAGRNRGARVGPDGKRYRPALPLDLHYMLTAWAPSAEQQQYLFAWALRTLEDTPVLPAEVLNHFVAQKAFFDDEGLELTPEPLSLEQMVSVWEVNKPQMQPSMTYAARLVAIESSTELEQFKPVQSRTLLAAQGGS
jgi:Pvc16 N-terminal domain